MTRPHRPAATTAVVAAALALFVGGRTSVAQAAPAPAPEVEIDWGTYTLLRGEDPKPVPRAPHAASRTVTLRPVLDGDPPGISVRATWQLETGAPGLLSGLLTGPAFEIDAATLDGKPAPTLRTPAGTLLVAYLDGPATLTLDGFLPAALSSDGGAFDLRLLSAVRGTIEVDHPELRPEVTRASEDRGATREGDRVWSGSPDLGLSLRRPTAEPADKGPLLLAHAGLGVTVGEAEVKLRSRVVWTLRRGSVDTLSVAVTGLSEDLEVRGPGIESWTREGDVIVLQLAGRVSTRVEAELSWSRPLRDVAEARFDVPRVAPEGAFRTDAALQLARDGEIEVVPELPGWTGVGGDELPEWGRGLVEGTPTAAYERGRTTGSAGSLSLLRFVPVPGPAVVVDVADYTIATSQDGRLIARAKYEVRNERAAFLRIEPPEGVEVIGARVGSGTALPARAEDGAWLLPLKRSLETVDGLLTFPVEVTLLGDGEAWTRREQRSMTLPTVGAPIAASRVTLYLPPRYRSKLEAGDGSVVEDFTEGKGITYGLSIGNEEAEQVDALFQEAVEDYRQGDFTASQQKLEQLGNVGASNDNVERLQSNLDLVTGNESGDGDRGGGKKDAVARRVKEQAKARAAEEFERQRELEEEADEAYRLGNYDVAEAAFEEAIALGDKLEKLEQKESVDTARRNVKLEGKLGNLKASKKRKIAFKKSAKAKNKRGPRLRARRRDREQTSAFAEMAPLSLPSGVGEDEGGGDGGGEGGSDGGGVGPDSVDDVAVYDFEDDSIDTRDQAQLDALDDRGAQLGKIEISGEELTPNGVEVAAEVAAEELADEPMPEPEPELRAMPRPDSRPLAEASERSGFVRRAAGRVRSVFRGRGGGGRRASRARMKKADIVSMKEPPVPAELDMPVTTTTSSSTTASPAKPRFIERLPAPEASASALSVVIPAIGEAVLYQTLLIEAGQPQTITIDAKRRLRRRK